MKLFVDDIRNPPDDSWTLARTVTEAIRAIARYDFEVISLDHDISHPVSIGNGLQRPFPCGETFAAVAYYLSAKYGNCMEDAPKVILHTSNQVAGDEMSMILAGFEVEKRYMGAATRPRNPQAGIDTA